MVSNDTSDPATNIVKSAESTVDASDLLDFPVQNSRDDTNKEAEEDFQDFKELSESLPVRKENKDGTIELTSGTIDAEEDAVKSEQGQDLLIESYKDSKEGDSGDNGATQTLPSADLAGDSATPAVPNGDAAVSSDTAGAAPVERTNRYVTAKDFELLKVIGMGAFGKVLQVRHKHSQRILAMKVISKRLLQRKSGYIENMHAERKILTRVRSPFVVTMHCSFQTKEKLFIIMDFLAGGELFLRLGREGIFLEATVSMI